MKNVVIIGGGASGLLSAILIKKQCPNCKVTILERLERVGKKILATGNGRCNFSNINVSSDKYNNKTFVEQFIKTFGYQEVSNVFSELGLVSRVDSEGRAYPYSEVANSFLDVLRVNLKKYGIIEKTNFEVTRIVNIGSKDEPQYVIENTRRQTVDADYIVIATGGKASPVLGSNGSGYALLKPWKVKVSNLEPGLVGIKVDTAKIRGLSGLRIKCRAMIYDKKAKENVWTEDGEVLFKDDGISGIVVMQMASIISRYEISRNHLHFYLALDLLPNYNEDELLKVLQQRQAVMKDLEVSEFFVGVFPKILALNILRNAKIDLSGYISDLSINELIRIVNTVKLYDFEYKGMYGFDRAQVTVGGIETSEFKKGTLELTKAPHMYAAGEIINVDGECGGYNMHWAFASACQVAKEITERVK